MVPADETSAASVAAGTTGIAVEEIVADGDPISSVFQKKLFIDLTAILKNEIPIFFGEGRLVVMLFLILDILFYHGNLIF